MSGAVCYEPVIGLEVHVELKTATKIFCACSTRFGALPNTQVCPICLGHPGVLPVLNRRVVEFALRAALALGCEIQETSQFARKNYFYPDLPKGYQITQYERSYAYGGHLDIEVGGVARRVGITRINIEEEAAKSFHGTGGGAGAEGRGEGGDKDRGEGGGESGGRNGAEYTLVDYNRGGVPLIEIVSEPDLRSPEEARAYLTKLRNLLLYTGISDCKMQEGSLRCDANVSLRPAGQSEFGNLVELKNMNSFRSVVRGLEYEIKRQTGVLEAGGRVTRETRGWDEGRGATFSMRSKEQSDDYRYFPEPDLVLLRTGPEWVAEVAAQMPALPDERRRRMVEEQGLSEYMAGVIVADPLMAAYFDRAVELGGAGGAAGGATGATSATGGGQVAAAAGISPGAIANWVTGDLARLANAGGLEFDSLPFGPAHLVDLLALVEAGKISGKMAKDLLEECWRAAAAGAGQPGTAATDEEPGQAQRSPMPSELARRMGLEQVSDEGQVSEVVAGVLTANAEAVASYHAGKDKAFGFLVGQVMKATRGRANPALVNRLVREALDEPGGGAGT